MNFDGIRVIKINLNTSNKVYNFQNDTFLDDKKILRIETFDANDIAYDENGTAIVAADRANQAYITMKDKNNTNVLNNVPYNQYSMSQNNGIVINFPDKGLQFDWGNSQLSFGTAPAATSVAIFSVYYKI